MVLLEYGKRSWIVETFILIIEGRLSCFNFVFVYSFV